MIPPYSQDGDGKLVWKNVHGGMMCLLLRAAGTRTPRYLTGLNLGGEMGAASSHELKQRLSRRPASELMAGAIHSLAAPQSTISRVSFAVAHFTPATTDSRFWNPTEPKQRCKKSR